MISILFFPYCTYTTGVRTCTYPCIRCTHNTVRNIINIDGHRCMQYDKNNFQIKILLSASVKVLC